MSGCVGGVAHAPHALDLIERGWRDGLRHKILLSYVTVTVYKHRGQQWHDQDLEKGVTIAIS